MGSGDWQVQQQVLDKAYQSVSDKVEKKEVKLIETTETEWAPDLRDNVHVWTQTYIPDPLWYLILITGFYGVFHYPINKFLTQVLGFNLDDLKQVVKRRKERDKELRDDTI